MKTGVNGLPSLITFQARATTISKLEARLRAVRCSPRRAPTASHREERPPTLKRVGELEAVGDDRQRQRLVGRHALQREDRGHARLVDAEAAGRDVDDLEEDREGGRADRGLQRDVDAEERRCRRGRRPRAASSRPRRQARASRDASISRSDVLHGAKFARDGGRHERRHAAAQRDERQRGDEDSGRDDGNRQREPEGDDAQAGSATSAISARAAKSRGGRRPSWSRLRRRARRGGSRGRGAPPRRP